MNSFIQLDKTDNVVVSLRALNVGDMIEVDGLSITVLSNIGFGHKVAIQMIPCGDKIIKYGLPIGHATDNILPGEHVHVHNLVSNYNS